MNKEIGIHTGDICNRNGCIGNILEYERTESCSCHINPPCSACTENRQYCDTCDWSAEDDY